MRGGRWTLGGIDLGVDLSPILKPEPKTLADFQGKVIAIDAYNALYQFLSIIRQPDGTPLKDRRGRVTSHLSGILYRTSNMVAEGIQPIFVFDGEPLALKRKTIVGRVDRRQRAEREWEEARARGDLATARTKAMQASRLTGEMVRQAQELLDLLGLPWVEAPADGEAQASYMAARGDAWAAGSQDYDSLLFGAPRLVKNLAVTGRRKLPRRQEYIDVQPELLTLQDVLQGLGINREQLVDVGLLVGTDFNEGPRGIGPKKALALVRKYGDLEAAMEGEGFTLQGYHELRSIFLEPKVTDDFRAKVGELRVPEAKAYLVVEYDFSEERVQGALDKMVQAAGKRNQRSLDQFF